MGPLGAGLKAKLARNLVQYGSWLAAYEAQVLAEAAGIELSKLAEVIRASDKLDRRRVAAHVPATPWRPCRPTPIAGIVERHGGGRRPGPQGPAGRHRARPEPRTCDLPLAAMTDARCDAVFGLDRFAADPARTPRASE